MNHLQDKIRIDVGRLHVIMCKRVSRFTLRAADICRSADAELNFWTVLTRNDACRIQSRPIDNQLQECELISCKKVMHQEQKHRHGRQSLLDLAALSSSVFSLHTAAVPQISSFEHVLARGKFANKIGNNNINKALSAAPLHCALLRNLPAIGALAISSLTSHQRMRATVMRSIYRCRY